MSPRLNIDPEVFKPSFRGAYEHQMDMQVNVFGDGVPLHEYPDHRKVKFIAEQVLAATDELHEALDEVGWKSWASSNHVNEEAFKGELVDAFHFFMNLMGVVEMTPDELLERYFRKAEKNLKRQQDGYDGVSTKCPGCKRALDDDAVKCRIESTDDGVTVWCDFLSQEITMADGSDGRG